MYCHQRSKENPKLQERRTKDESMTNWVFVDCTSVDEEERYRLKKKEVSPKNSNFSFQEIHFKIPPKQSTTPKRKLETKEKDPVSTKKQRTGEPQQRTHYSQNASIMPTCPTLLASAIPSTFQQNVYMSVPYTQPVPMLDNTLGNNTTMIEDFALLEEIEAWFTCSA